MANNIQKWAEKIDWKKRVKSICKPCWELKYCPYGILVEEFPLKDENDEQSCRIYGHDCPVFFVAEPLTETRELRNISRNISRTTQFKVLKRDNQICADCGNSVLDYDIEFDHIIPWSKGGSSDEYNIRSLCSSCNKKRGNRFEFEALVTDVRDHMIKQEDESIFKFFETFVIYGQMYHTEHGSLPTAQDIADEYFEGKVTPFEEKVADIINDMETYFNYNDTIDIPKTYHKALKIRWGFNKKGNTYPFEMKSLKNVSLQFKLSQERLVQYEINLIEKFGFRVKRDKKVLMKWKEL